MERLESISIWAIAILFFSVTIFYEGLAEAVNPKSVKIKVYKVEFFTDKNATPITVFETEGVEKDIIAETNALFGSGSIPAGKYKRIKFTVAPQGSFSGPNPCGGSDLIDAQFNIGSNELHFANADDGGGQGWSANGSESYPFLLMNPVDVEVGVTTNIKIIFNTRDTLQCVNNNPYLYPPTMNIVQWKEEEPSSACTFPSDYWFMHYNLYVNFENIGHNPPYGVSEILPYSMVIAGWGSGSFSAPDSSGKGTMTINGDLAYDKGGMAEHRHHFDRYDPNNQDEGYHNPAGGGTMTVPYQMSGRKMVINMGEGAIELAFSDDCSTFIGTMVSSGQDGGSNNIVFGVRKDWNQGTTIPDGKYAGVSFRFGLNYNNLQLQYMNFQGEMNVLNVTTDAIDMLSWGSHMELMPGYLMQNPPPVDKFMIPTNVNLKHPATEKLDVTTGMPLSVFNIDQGLVTISGDPNFDSFVAFNNNLVGIEAGATQESRTESNGNNHYIQSGAFVKLYDNSQLSDLAGRWYLVLLENDAQPGQDNTWATGDEDLWFGITYGELTIDSSGNVTSRTFTHRNIFDNTTEGETGSGETIVLRTECYKQDTLLTDQTCSGGIQIPVFVVKDTNGVEMAKIALAQNKNVAVIWGSPIDVDDSTSGSEKDKPQNTDWQNQSYKYANQKQLRGMLVKIE